MFRSSFLFHSLSVFSVFSSNVVCCFAEKISYFLVDSRVGSLSVSMVVYIYSVIA